MLQPPARWVAVSALASAAAALALPGATGEVAGIASVVTLGGLALLAGHAWGLLVVVAAQVLLLAHVWPLVALTPPAAPVAQATAAAATVASLPAVARLGVALPGLADVLLDEPSARARAVCVAMGAVGAAAALLAPVL
ncbi:MAG: hypothetical protein D6689_09950 [Deltaproteobacteria bacterium]|nr:MAG: hypothetical protein D6689_09950 [Deltaproteobacteria bacterium]